MIAAPRVSIVIPVFNDESTIEAAVESCLSQTLDAIEVICVDDASTDGTVAAIERIAATDQRVKLIRHDVNMSAFQSRRTGILAARAPHVLFLDGDDELRTHAAATAVAAADAAGVDILGFAVTVVEPDGRTGGAYESRLRPRHQRLSGVDVVRGLFPIGRPAQGQLWRHLYRTEVLRRAVACLPGELVLPRVNDLPLLFVVSCIATSYASIDSKLYRYHFGRGGSGHVVDSLTRAQFYTSAITAIDSISPAVQKIAAGHAHPAAVSAAYESARASIIGYVASQLIEHSTSAVLGAALEHLRSVANESDIIRAITRFYPQLLSSLRLHSPRLQDGSRSVRTIALVTGTLRTGGVSAVIAAQTRFLSEAGYRVVVIARTPGGDASPLPPGTTFLELRDRELSGKLQEWQRICGSNDIDLVIDHQILYTSDWPQFALVARGEGAATIGWLHNSVARPILVGNDRLSLIERCSSLLSKLVTLSRLDAAYFSLRGIDHAVWLPNPPSPLMLSAPAPRTPKPFSPDRIELVWWGRLEQRTKQVYDLISVGAALDRLSVEYHLTVIGPDWDDVTAAKFNARARQYGVAERVVAIGPRRGQALIDAIDAAHLFVSTSVIEGYQLTIAEAQSRGLPVVMYELPWLDLVQDNEGIIAVPQGDADAIAAEIATLASNPSRYTELSNASLAASERVLRRDLPGLYRDLVEDTLPVSFTPKATINDAGALLGLIVSFAERAQTGSRSRRPPSARVGRVWRSLAPLGRAVAKRLPGLRPLIHRAKKALGLT